MSSKLLDFVRPGRKSRAILEAEGLTEVAAQVPLPEEAAPQAVPAAPIPGGFRSSHDYPTIGDWLDRCARHMERGRDGHDYASMALVFALNGCTRIDDITRLTPAEIRDLARDRGVDVTVGLVNRVLQYATEDVARVKANGEI